MSQENVEMTPGVESPSGRDVQPPPRTMRIGPGRLAPVQWAAILGSAAVLLWSIPGLIVNPDFSVGNSATAVRVLGVDMNGWHAVSGFLIVVPCLLSLRRPAFEASVLALSAAGLLGTA